VLSVGVPSRAGAPAASVIFDIETHAGRPVRDVSGIRSGTALAANGRRQPSPAADSRSPHRAYGLRYTLTRFAQRRAGLRPSTTAERLADVKAELLVRPCFELVTVKPRPLRDPKRRVQRVPKNNGAIYLVIRTAGHKHRTFDELYQRQARRAAER